MISMGKNYKERSLIGPVATVDTSLRFCQISVVKKGTVSAKDIAEKKMFDTQDDVFCFSGLEQDLLVL